MENFVEKRAEWNPSKQEKPLPSVLCSQRARKERMLTCAISFMCIYKFTIIIVPNTQKKVSLSLRLRRQPQHLTHIRSSEHTRVYLWLMFVCVVPYSVHCVLFIFKQFRLSQFTSNSRFLLEPITLYLSGGRWSGAHIVSLVCCCCVVHVIAWPSRIPSASALSWYGTEATATIVARLLCTIYFLLCSDRRQMIVDWINVIWMHNVPYSRHSLVHAACVRILVLFNVHNNSNNLTIGRTS